MKRKTVRVSTLLLFLVMSVFLVQCAMFQTVQEQWNKLTPDEKSRVITNDLQNQIDDLVDTGKAYVILNPQYQDKWKKDIIPLFDAANKSLGAAIQLASTGDLTPDQVYEKVQPALNAIITALGSIGYKKK